MVDAEGRGGRHPVVAGKPVVRPQPTNHHADRIQVKGGELLFTPKCTLDLSG